jgi:methylenetetrahydrofolate dehydrogenase (NADP+)/methenyltetrahydrofolate cyclohydrolase
MTAIVMDGTTVARRLSEETARRARALEERRARPVRLATVLVGDDPASRTYLRMKADRCADAGVASQRHDLPDDADTDQVVRLVKQLSVDPDVDGILVQHPVPEQVDERAVFEAIAPTKDVDGVTTASFAAMAFNQPGFASCTPAGIMRLLDAYDVPIAGQHAVVVGRSPILGKPMGMLLLARDATVTFCHSKTGDLAEVVSRADILVAAVGRPALIHGDWLRPGAVVIDAGYNAGNIGDVDYASAVTRARLITPVPGGVGPMTLAVLLANTVDAAERSTSTTAKPAATPAGSAIPDERRDEP